jgi:hypothetical protein
VVGCGNFEKKKKKIKSNSPFLCFSCFFEKIGICVIFEKQKKALFFIRRLSKEKNKQNGQSRIGFHFFKLLQNTRGPFNNVQKR